MKKKTPALLAFFTLYPITNILISYLLTINSKTAVINISENINLQYFNKSQLKPLVKKNAILFVKNRIIPAAIALIKEKSNSFEKPIFKILLPNLPIAIITKTFLL